MRDPHSRFFRLSMMELDGHPLSSSQRDALQTHLSSCPACRADLKIYQKLRAEASLRWPAAPPTMISEKLLQDAQKRRRLRRATRPLREALWIGLAILALLLANWIFTELRPTPAGLPAGSPTPAAPTPESTPTGSAHETGKVPVEPLLQGDPYGYGSGSWSPDGDDFFIPILEPPPPGGDRRITSLHFISAVTGEDCPASETFLGQQGSQNYAWLDNERVLFIDNLGRPLLFTRCQAGSQDLGDRFDEPLLRIALPIAYPEISYEGPKLLETSSAYWLLDPATLEARALADPIPSPELGDSFAWLPSGQQIAVLQPVEQEAAHSRLVLIDLDSGQVIRSVEIEASDEGRAPIVEWLDADRAFIWSFGEGGPLLVDLSVDPPRQVRVLPELFGLDLIYPDQMSSMGVFYSPENNSYHIVAHINLPEDTSIYLYHGENGQVEQLAGDRPVMMIFPGDQRMPLAPLLDTPEQNTPTVGDGYDLVWVDRPGQPQVYLQVAGHTPRNYPNLQSRLIPGSAHMLFGSSQGISLVNLSSGDTETFWQLVGAEEATLPSLSVNPQGHSLIAVAYHDDTQKHSNLLYWISLEK